MPGPRDRLGRRAEALAATYLDGRGYHILCRRYRVPTGEIDLVARDGDTLVFVEVRARQSDALGHPLQTVGARKRARIVQAARCYLGGLQGPWPPMRFDVLGIVWPGGDSGAAPEAAQLSLVQDAFDDGGMRNHGR